MSLPDFLSASYALLAEEHQRINPLKDLLSVAQEVTPTAPHTRNPIVKTTVAAQNQQSMSMLEGMMAGKANNPLAKKRKPRRA